VPVHQSHTVQHGAREQSIFVFARTPDGRPATNLDPASGSATFIRTSGSATAIELHGGEVGVHEAGSLSEVDRDMLPGVYAFDVPDSALAPGATEVVLVIRFADALVDPVKFNLVAYDPQHAWSLGMTQLQDYKRHQVLRRALPRFTELELALGTDNEQTLADRLGEVRPGWAEEAGV
jgi:hypothetical protein